MATNAQIEANRRNSLSSTGPRTESGKSRSSKNRLTFGLYTHQACVEPADEDIYAEFCQTMYDQLTPANLLEETFVFEITEATWRLRRCAAAEADLMDFDEVSDKTRRGIERARASAHRVVQRSLSQLRKIQTERIIRQETRLGSLCDTLAADSQQIVAAQKRTGGAQRQEADDAFEQALANAMNPVGVPSLADLQEMLDEERARKADELASNCNTGDLAADSYPEAPILAPNPLCPCESGLIAEKCCEQHVLWPAKKAA